MGEILLLHGLLPIMEFECIGVANVQVNVVFCYEWPGDGEGSSNYSNAGRTGEVVKHITIILMSSCKTLMII